MKIYLLSSILLFMLNPLVVHAEIDSKGMYQFPVVQPVKPMPSFENYESECALKKKEHTQLYSISGNIEYPVVQTRIRQEGWVVLSYDIVQGKIENINVVDSSPDKSFPENSFESAAKSSLRRSKVIGYDGTLHGCITEMKYKINN